MFKYKRIILKLLIITFVISSFPIYFVFANPLDSWQSPKAYKPKPVLFLHGFAKGSPLDWNGTKTALNIYFSKYQSLGSYLETIDFQDSNGSVDRYPSGKFNPQSNSAGWADKVKNKVEGLLSSAKYGSYTNKLNLVCHSMGGLAARWYLANYSSDFVDKLILIGVPNFGSRWAELANAASKVPKVGWLNVLTTSSLMSIARQDVNFALWFLREIDVYGEAVDDMDLSPTGSGFLNNLNSLPQPQGISYYGIVGIVGSFMNRYIADGDYYGGDCIVSKASQLGTGTVSYKEWSQINTNHWREIKVAGEGTFSSILYFLDSTKPVLEITSPSTSGTADIYGTSVRIQGKVYNEYLPADTKLIINVVEESSGKVVINNQQRPNAVKPSDLWIPNNPDSLVAEIDETINLPGSGKYKISCQLKNPADQTSDRIEFSVNLTFTEGTNIVVHCHNPEGKEIASIQGMDQYSVEIYDGNRLIGHGARNAETHNQPIKISSGTHTVKAKFNGMTKEETTTINSNETKIIIFMFERTEFDLSSYINNYSINKGVSEHYYTKNIHPPFQCETNKGTEDYYIDNPFYPYGGILYDTMIMDSSVKGGEMSADLISTVIFSELMLDIYIQVFASWQPTEVGEVVLWAWSHFDSLAIKCSKPILPSNDSFVNWFVQFVANGYIPILKFKINGSDCNILETPNFWQDPPAHDNEYFFRTIPNNIVQSEPTLQIVSRNDKDLRAGLSQFHVTPTTPADSYTESFHYSGTISNLKMSSIPYDLLENAI